MSIVHGWISPAGWLGSCIWNLTEFGKVLFQNSLPAAPQAGLQALESGLPVYDADTPITTGDYVPGALRSLAWEASLFDRCVRLLQILAIYGEGGIATSATEVHKSLFSLYLSGTHATVEQRSAITKKLLASADAAERDLGTAALGAMLRSMHFSSSYDFQFGAHSRDYGYQPKNYDELRHWYKTSFSVAAEIALSDGAAAHAVKRLISANFRGLWTKVGLRDELESISARFAAQAFWRDGWLAAKQVLHYDEKDTASDSYARLSKLEQALRPRGLVQRARGRVLVSYAVYNADEIDISDPGSFRVAIEQRNTEAEALGGEIANDQAALEERMPEISKREG